MTYGYRSWDKVLKSAREPFGMAIVFATLPQDEEGHTLWTCSHCGKQGQWGADWRTHGSDILEDEGVCCAMLCPDCPSDCLVGPPRRTKPLALARERFLPLGSLDFCMSIPAGDEDGPQRALHVIRIGSPALRIPELRRSFVAFPCQS